MTMSDPANPHSTRRAATAAKPADLMSLPLLSPQHETFAFALARGMKQADAFREAYPQAAGWQRQSVYVQASKLAASPPIRKRVEHLLRQAAQAHELAIQDVLRQYLIVLRADPRDLVAIHVGPCRHCWGRGHRYQYTDAELVELRVRNVPKGTRRRDAQDEPTSEQGGGGFNAGHAPHPDCPSCGGDGVARMAMKDSRGYGPEAQALFAGARQGPHGVEVKLHDRMAALLQIARHVGFFDPAPQEEAATPLDTAALDQLYEEARAKMAAREQSVAGRSERLRALERSTQDAPLA